MCGWQVKLCDPLVTRGPYLSALEIRSLYIKRSINSPSFFYFAILHTVLKFQFDRACFPEKSSKQAQTSVLVTTCVYVSIADTIRRLQLDGRILNLANLVSCLLSQ